MSKTQQEIIRQGYQALVDSLGIVDSVRFIQHLSLGQGDYTQERYAWIDQTPLENILSTMRHCPGDDTAQYDEIIE